MKGEAYLGIDIGGTNVKMALVSPVGKILTRGLIETDVKQGPEDVFKRIALAVPTLLTGGRRLVAAGIGCAGLIDVGRGVLLTSPNLPSWREVPIRRIAGRVLGVQTVVDNDANAAAYGEYRAGAGRGYDNVVCITLGTGVGGGIISDGKVLRGGHNFAGEIGHVAINMDGPRCKCGNRGCLEAYIGKQALVRSARAKLKTRGGRILGRLSTRQLRSLNPRMIQEAALQGDRTAREVFYEAADYLGSGIAVLVNLLNPEVVAIGGGVSGAYELMEARLKKAVRARAYDEAAAVVKICRTRLGNDSSTVGAALYAKDMAV